jgi:GNAT superfamily N-acetyltransferase
MLKLTRGASDIIEMKSGARGGANASMRRATVADASLLARLRYAFRASVGALSEGEAEFVERCRLWMEARLGADDRWHVWVAEQGGVLVGNLWLQLIEKIPNPTTEPEHHAYVTNFYVAEAARGQGIGSMLLTAALRWCETRGVHAVLLWPTEQSRSLYLRHGFAVREDLLELLIER